MCASQMRESSLATGRGTCATQPGGLGTTIFPGNIGCVKAEGMGGPHLVHFSREKYAPVAFQARPKGR